jgi:hypothetical protein
MAYDLLLRRQIARDHSRGDEICLIPALAPDRAGLRRIAIMGLGIAAALASSYPKIQRGREHRHYRKEFSDDPRITQRLPITSDDTLMNYHKTKPTSKQQGKQKQAKLDLEQERQHYRQMYSKDRAITQEIPVTPMYNLVHGGR